MKKKNGNYFKYLKNVFYSNTFKGKYMNIYYIEYNLYTE